MGVVWAEHTSSLELVLARGGGHVRRGERPVEAIHVIEPVRRHNTFALREGGRERERQREREREREREKERKRERER